MIYNGETKSWDRPGAPDASSMADVQVLQDVTKVATFRIIAVRKQVLCQSTWLANLVNGSGREVASEPDDSSEAKVPSAEQCLPPVEERAQTGWSAYFHGAHTSVGRSGLRTKLHLRTRCCEVSQRCAELHGNCLEL